MPSSPSPLTPSLMRQLEAFSLTTRRAYRGMRAGTHRSLKRGVGLEFSDYRQYELGDNPRHIDWGVYARSERLYVKQFHEEENLSVLIVLDPSGSMTVDRSKWEFAKLFALSIAYIALTNQDTVRLSILGYGPGPRFNGARSIHEAVRFLQEFDTTPQKTLPKKAATRSLQHAVSTMRFPGLALFISDFLFDLDLTTDLTNTFTSRNLETHFIQVLGEQDLNPLPLNDSASVLDSETGSEIDIDLSPSSRDRYMEFLNLHQTDLRKLCASRQISHTLVNLKDPIDSFLFPALSQTQFIQ